MSKFFSEEERFSINHQRPAQASTGESNEALPTVAVGAFGCGRIVPRAHRQTCKISRSWKSHSIFLLKIFFLLSFSIWKCFFLVALEFGHAAMQCTAIAEDSVLPETNLSKRDGRSLLSLRSPRSIYKTVYFFQEFETTSSAYLMTKKLGFLSHRNLCWERSKLVRACVRVYGSYPVIKYMYKCVCICVMQPL